MEPRSVPGALDNGSAGQGAGCTWHSQTATVDRPDPVARAGHRRAW